MTEPTIAQRGPYPVELEAGKSYSWCACGLSANQPFCDGSHRGSGISAVMSRKPWRRGSITNG